MNGKLTGKRKFNPPQAKVEVDAAKERKISLKEDDGDRDVEGGIIGVISPSTSSACTEIVATESKIERSPKPIISRFEGFRNVLYKYIRDDESSMEGIIFRSDICSLIVDAYAKASVHLLLIPMESFYRIREVKEMNAESFQKIQEFHQIAHQVASCIELGDRSICPLISEEWFLKIRKNYQHQPLRCGYHAIPSLYPLHLHIISADFISPRMNKKIHWNKFTTEFFVTTKTVEQFLTASSHRSQCLGSMLPSDDVYDALLRQPLACHCCGENFKTMPKLTTHVSDCIRKRR